MIKGSVIVTFIVTVISSASLNAALPSGARLSIDAGSNFGMEVSPGLWVDTQITGFNGIILGTSQLAWGSHSGPVNSAELPDIDNPWILFGNTGMHQTTSPVVALTESGNTATVDFSGWALSWNSIPAIPMSDGTSGDIVSIICAVDCGDGDTYTLSYLATVATGDPSGFGDINYRLNLMGTVNVCNDDQSAPVANDDAFFVAAGSTDNLLSITANDYDTGCSGLWRGRIDLDPVTAGRQTSITAAFGGIVVVDAIKGAVSYSPPAGFHGEEVFQYTVTDNGDGVHPVNVSNIARVAISVANLAPICNDDTVLFDSFNGTAVNINVLANDTDPVVSTMLVGDSVTIVDAPLKGTVQVLLDGTGTIVYTPNANFAGTVDTFTYTVQDSDPVAPLSCAKATVTVLNTIEDPCVTDAYLVINSGRFSVATTRPALGQGSWFSMEMNPGVFNYTAVAGYEHIKPGTTQTAQASNRSNIDYVWNFFGNDGVHQTTSDLVLLSDDGSGNVTLDFSGWSILWNQIPSIPLNAGPDNGVATLTCYTDLLAGTPGTCAAGDEYLLSYRAIVPVGDPSGFGGVNYALHFEGIISNTVPDCIVYPPDVTDVAVINGYGSSAGLTFGSGSTASAVGNTSGRNLTSTQIGQLDPLLNPNDGRMCVGGCLDFVIENLTTEYVDIVVKLSEAIQSGSIYRKLINGRWQDFDVTGNDLIGSQPVDSVTGNCQSPNGVYAIGLIAGNQCLFLRIYDGGPNDADVVVNGTIVDPSGVLLPGSTNSPTGSSGGCSVSSVPVKLTDHVDWLLLVASIASLGLLVYGRTRHSIH